MAQPNYKFEKRQKDLAKKAKKLEKQQRKSEKMLDQNPDGGDGIVEEAGEQVSD